MSKTIEDKTNQERIDKLSENIRKRQYLMGKNSGRANRKIRKAVKEFSNERRYLNKVRRKPSLYELRKISPYSI